MKNVIVLEIIIQEIILETIIQRIAVITAAEIQIIKTKINQKKDGFKSFFSCLEDYTNYSLFLVFHWQYACKSLLSKHHYGRVTLE